MKKMLLMAILLIGAISYGAAGLDLKFNTDGKLHEEKLARKPLHQLEIMNQWQK